MLDDYVTIEVNGHQADQAVMSLLEYEGWGHFTAMQVRGGRTVRWCDRLPVVSVTATLYLMTINDIPNHRKRSRPAEAGLDR